MVATSTPTRSVSEGTIFALLALRVGVIPQMALALLLLLLPTARADDWKFDVLVLKPGVPPEGPRVLKGLFIGYQEDAAEITIRVIHRDTNEPTRIEPAPFVIPRTRIESLQPLDADARSELERRVKALTRTPREVKKRIGELKFAPTDIELGKGVKKKGFRYADEVGQFTLEAIVGEEVFRQSAERLALIFNAYQHTLPPRKPSARPIAILLIGTQADYQAYLKGRNLNFSNPAFYDPARNQIVCGADLLRLDGQLAQARQANEKVRGELDKRVIELKKVYKGGIVPPAVMRPIDEARQQLAAAEAANTKLFDDATQMLFRRLYHESFHAYLANFVYTGDRAEMPRWLNEKMAQLFETPLIEGDEVRIVQPDPDRLKRAKAALSANDVVPLKDLLRSGPKQFVVAHASDKEISDRFYLTSWALALHLTREMKILNTKKLDDYCRATCAKTDPQEAFAALVETRLDQFEEKFHRYVRELQVPRVRPK